MPELALDAALVKRLLEVAVLLAVAVIDFRTRRIPNRLILPATAASLLGAAIVGVPDVLSALLGSLLAGGLFALLVGVGAWLGWPRALGVGDVKLAAFIGAIFGVPAVLAALFWGVLAGGLAGVAVLVFALAARRPPLTTRFAYGPWLVLGAIVALALPA